MYCMLSAIYCMFYVTVKAVICLLSDILHYYSTVALCNLPKTIPKNKLKESTVCLVVSLVHKSKDKVLSLRKKYFKKMLIF